MNVTMARTLIAVLILVLLIFAVVPVLTASDNKTKELIESETLACVVESCITDKTLGQECFILKPKLSKLRITVDENNHQHVSIVPTDIDCR